MLQARVWAFGYSFLFSSASDHISGVWYFNNSNRARRSPGLDRIVTKVERVARFFF